MILLLLGGDGEGSINLGSFFSGPQELLDFIIGLFQAILSFLTGMPDWITQAE